MTLACTWVGEVAVGLFVLETAVVETAETPCHTRTDVERYIITHITKRWRDA
jgi:hypothetical protein